MVGFGLCANVNALVGGLMGLSRDMDITPRLDGVAIVIGVGDQL
jgi:hypothetical protein